MNNMTMSPMNIQDLKMLSNVNPFNECDFFINSFKIILSSWTGHWTLPKMDDGVSQDLIVVTLGPSY